MIALSLLGCLVPDPDTAATAGTTTTNAETTTTNAETTTTNAETTTTNAGTTAGASSTTETGVSGSTGSSAATTSTSSTHGSGSTTTAGSWVADACGWGIAAFYGDEAFFATIQAGVDAGVPTLEVCPGTWVGNVVIEHEIELRGATGPVPSILEGEGTDSVLSIRAGALAVVVLEDLVIQGGDASYGGGMKVFDTSLLLDGVLVHENQATTGGGIYAEASNLYLMNSMVEDNVGVDGGGMFLYQVALSGWNGTVIHNRAVSGGGIGIDEGWIQGIWIQGNTASSYGGGISSLDGSVEGVSLWQNTAEMGGGLYFEGHPDGTYATIADVWAVGNEALEDGGGMYLVGGISIERSEVGNSVAGNRGGGFYVLGGSAVDDRYENEWNQVTTSGNLAAAGNDIYLASGSVRSTQPYSYEAIQVRLLDASYEIPSGVSFVCNAARNCTW